MHTGRVQAVGGLVEDQDARVAEQCGGEAEPLAHAQREAADAASSRRGQIDLREHRVHPGGWDAAREGEHAQVVAGGASRMETGRLEHGADVVRGAIQAGIADAVDQGRPGRRPHQTEKYPQRGGLARPVRADKAGDRAGLHVETEIVDGENTAEPFG